MTSIKFRALTPEERKLFFEALGEYGKDFSNIQQYMAQKSGKASSKSSENQSKTTDPQEKREQDKKDDDKKREQIRNFYNKLYTTYSQLVGKLDDRVEKVNQELYLLINFGEMWKKLGKLGFKFDKINKKKTKKLLEELVYQGSSNLRFKNKNVRLRTPPCKALKKINAIGIDEKDKVVSTRELPKDVIVEFRPAANRDWLKVQSMSQNPRVTARLSIQKRLSTIIEFLENKWNITHDQLNRTVDVWLKVTPNNHCMEDLNLHPCPAPNVSNSNSNGLSCDPTSRNLESKNNEEDQTSATNSTACNIHQRLRLKPSIIHELKEVNITRVVPDNHLDLSLNAYINRISELKPKICGTSSNLAKFQGNKDSPTNARTATLNNIPEDINMNLSDNHFELSLGGLSTDSKLPISLTTPDSSILLERSCTSDQPSIAQARKHLSFLQSLTGSLEGCENSRTACEDTQDRTLGLIPVHNENSRFVGSCTDGSFRVEVERHSSSTNPTILVNNNIPALHDEDAALPVSSTTSAAQQFSNNPQSIQQNCDNSQNSKSVDFHIPKNVTLGDFFKMNDQIGGDDVANDAFPQPTAEDEMASIKSSPEKSATDGQSPKDSAKDSSVGLGDQARPQNHLIEIKKMAEGWTRQDDSSMTIGELFLAFKCPEKIILEYEFEQFTYENPLAKTNAEQQLPVDTNDSLANTLVIKKVEQEASTSSGGLIFKLLTAASLSLSQIERVKIEQQHKLRDQQNCSKFKRRKGSGQNQTMTQHDSEATNQRVEEALRQLQPTRLSCYRRQVGRQLGS